ncbi:MAG: xylulokinase, partial [Deltaproteobacteria bacterium]|nr:xylulokinase [Deltaproteobacteria bacterium]
MNREAIITVDAGTTFSKTLVWDSDGVVLGQSRRMNQPIYPRPGWAEQTPNSWWDNTCHTISAALKEAIAQNSDIHITAVALTSCRDIVIPIDRRSEPLANAILWMDTRANNEAEEIAKQIGSDAIHRKTGMIPGPTFPACKILWLKKNRPEQVKNCAYFLQPRDYVFYRLTGELMTDYSMASRTMMFDQETNAWWDAMFDLLHIKKSRFPELADALAFRPVRLEVARQLGLPPQTPVVLGGGDRQCEALGAMVSERRAMDSTGTATNISLSGTKDTTPYHPKIVRSIHVIPDELLMEVTINTSGLAMEYFRELFRGGDTYFEQIEAQAARVPAGSNGLIALPFFMGARSVRWNPRATGA